MKSKEEIAYKDCFESYYREHLDQLRGDYHPYSCANFSIDFLREILTLPDVDVKRIIGYSYNDWLGTYKERAITIWDWINQFHPEYFEFFK